MKRMRPGILVAAVAAVVALAPLAAQNTTSPTTRRAFDLEDILAYRGLGVTTLTNMISMYSIIYKNTGGTNGAIFESSQGRFTGGPWEEWAAYTRNSPVAHAKNVKTPLMMLHNDQDGAVDFTQGIEYFNTLRRLGKPVILLEYPGENHGLARPANQQDYTVRMKEFFDHQLKGAPAPDWLKYGVPRLKMQEHIDKRLKERQDKQKVVPPGGGSGY